MPSIKMTFLNQQDEELAGLLELPESEPGAYAIFAHCFTCSKDIAAASRISRALAKKGIAVLRFDFTGLGNSDGDFANTNFSSNLQDLVSAADYLGRHYQAPAMLIGHSLGGAAVLAAARDIPSVRAIVSIGAPATADHVSNLFAHSKDKILNEDKAEVNLAGRCFTIKKQFLEDLTSHNTTEHIANLGKALLILHSPVDKTVSIDEAAKIYQAAKHPKSFISLDQADHLLSRREDSQYAAEVIAGWAGRYLDLSTVREEASAGTAPQIESGQILITEQNKQFTRRIYTEKHQLLADEPDSSGGRDLGPNPYEYLLAALGACTSMTLRMYANRKQIDLDNINILLKYSRIHAEDCLACESKQGMVDRIDKIITLEGNLTQDQKDRLLEISDKCPVHKTLLNEILIETKLN